MELNSEGEETTKNSSEKKDIVSDYSDINNSEDDKEKKKVVSNLPDESKVQKIIVRTITAIFMVGFYLGMLRGGHFYCLLTAVATQVCVYLI